MKIKCDKCKIETDRTSKSVKTNPNGCLICAGKKVVKGYNDLLTSFPEIIKIWDYEKNKTPPQEHTKGSDKKVWIKCRKCKYSTLRKISATTRNPQSCSVCSGKKVIQGYNDLATIHPHIAKEWDYEKNSLRPEEIIHTGGRRKAYLNCQKCGQSREIYLSSRIKNDCVYCSGQKTAKGQNDLATTRKIILKHWDYKKNCIDPSEISANTNKKFWWMCENGHSHLASPKQKWDKKNNRVRKCKKCPTETTSQGQEELFEFCKKLDNKTTLNNKEILKNKELDIVFHKKKIAIEYNGEYWHSNKIIQEKYGITSKEYHERKVVEAKEKNYELLFVWEKDWNNNREYIIHCIKRKFLYNENNLILTKTVNI